jgi:2-C-methyl-D-erythritol 4-phosphate cytidylyltransferase
VLKLQNIDDIYTSAVVVAAGSGSRMKLKEKKQFVKIGGVPLLARTLLMFENCSLINEIIVVVSKEDISHCKRKIIEKYKLYKVKTIIAGGENRQESVFNGLLETSPYSDLIMIQDGARPFTDGNVIKRCIEAASEYGASVPAVKVKDTIKRVGDEGFIIETVDRSALWSVQTPQTFKRDIIIDAHIKASKDVTYTDDSMMAESIGINVKIVDGSYHNIKITTQDDLITAEAIAAAVASQST